MRAVRVLALGLIIGAIAATSFATTERERYVVLEVEGRAELESLTRLVDIDRVDGTRVWAYVSPPQVGPLAEAGYTWRELPLPGQNAGARMGLAKRVAIGAWNAYPTYSEYVAMMEGFAADYPDLCRLVEIGDTTNQVRPHALLAVKISDNPDEEEDEPEVLYTSTMHGDETVGLVLTLRLADLLLSSYDPTSDDPEVQRLTNLVDELEIWINPAANPDGTWFASDDSVADAIRYYTDANGVATWVNPNRNFPDPEDGDHPDGEAWWAETQAMMAFAEAHTFVLAANFHGGAEVVNYPWDTWARLHADNDWWVRVSRAYADSVHQAATTPPYDDSGYMTDLDDGITNGYAWYSISGGRQDFMNFWHGCREATVELSWIKNPPASLLPTYWDYNRDALLGYLEAALEGVRGVVVDTDGNPVAARVEVAWHDVEADASWVHTDPEVGDFHRMLLPGSYTLVFSAPGYYSLATHPIQVFDGPARRIEVEMVPDNGGALDTNVGGVVQRAGTGQPIAHATVTLVWPFTEEFVTTSDGRYSFTVPEGACLLEVAAEGYRTERLAHNAVYPDSTLDLSLVPVITVEPNGVRPIIRP